MRRLTIVVLMWWGMVTGIMAVPAKKGLWQTIRLSDGTEIMAQLVGDEFFHGMQSEDGTLYVWNGVAYENVNVNDNGNYNKRVNVRRKRARWRQMERIAKARNNAYVGTKRGLIILANFADTKFKDEHDRDLYDRIANEPNFSAEDGFHGSVSDYFKAQSQGVFDLEFDVVGPVTMANNHSYYGRDIGLRGNDARPGEMVVEACMAVDDEIDFTQYDWDGDGEVEQVFVVYAGLGQASGGASDTVWPHMWQLSDRDNYGEPIMLDGVTVDTYACSAELVWGGVYSGSRLDGIGTFCHEFSHCLGLPDVYDTDGNNYGMSNWDLMDYGNYNDDGFTPAGYTSYEKMTVGWLEPIVLDADCEVEGMQPLSEGGNAYIIYNDNHPDEYYLLENRQQTEWDMALYGHGLLVLHVDYDELCWINNTVNAIGTFYEEDGYTQDFTNDVERLTLINADNSRVNRQSDIAADAFPSGSNNCLTNTSKPRAATNNPNIDGNKLMNISITDITEHDDGTISFNFAKIAADTAKVVMLLHETFDKCTGSGGNDGQWSGNIASSNCYPDLDGWVEAGNHLYGGDACARVGTSSATGVLTSPSFSMNGKAKFMIRVAPWGKDKPSLDVMLDDDYVDSYTLNDEEWNEITVEIEGRGSHQLTFIGCNRFFLDEVKVYEEETTSVSTYTKMPPRENTKIFTLGGQCVTGSLQSLPHGVYIVGGKKVVR